MNVEKYDDLLLWNNDTIFKFYNCSNPTNIQKQNIFMIQQKLQKSTLL